MHKLFAIVILPAFLVSAGCASKSAPTAATSDAAVQEAQLVATEAAPNDPNELICRNEVVTGSNFRRKVCRTRAQLEEANTQTQDVLDYQRRLPTER